MNNMAASTLTTIDTAEMVANHIGDHVQEKVEKIREKKAAGKGLLRRAINFWSNFKVTSGFQEVNSGIEEQRKIKA